MENHKPHGITHQAAVTFPPLPQPKLVLDLATPEWCKDALTWVVQDSLPSKDGQLSHKWPGSVRAGSWVESATSCQEFGVLTTRTQRHSSIMANINTVCVTVRGHIAIASLPFSGKPHKFERSWFHLSYTIKSSAYWFSKSEGMVRFFSHITM